MKDKSYFYMNGVFGKEGPYPCEILFKLGPWRVIRFATVWDGGLFTTYRTRIKLFWNVVEKKV